MSSPLPPRGRKYGCPLAKCWSPWEWWIFQLGCWTFRKFLVKTRADENLRFWEAVAEFKKIAKLSDRENSDELLQRANRIISTFLGQPHSTPIPDPTPTCCREGMLERGESAVGAASDDNAADGGRERRPRTRIRRSCLNRRAAPANRDAQESKCSA